MNICQTVYTTGLSGRLSYLDTLAKCLAGPCDRVPMTGVLNHSSYRVMIIVHTHKSRVCLSSIKQSWERNKSLLDKYTNISHPFDLCHIYRQSAGR